MINEPKVCPNCQSQDLVENEVVIRCNECHEASFTPDIDVDTLPCPEAQCSKDVLAKLKSNPGGLHCTCPACSADTLPDTGSRTEFATGAVRDSMEGKGFPSMIPPIALKAIAQRFEEGSKKYSKSNWMKGIPLARYHDAAFRHLLAWSEGDQSENHGGAALWNIACALWTEEQIKLGLLPEELNDLPYYKKS